jgi:outer membrane protein assembly factor BamB
MSTILSLFNPYRIAIDSDGFAFVTSFSTTVIKLNLKDGSYTNFATITNAQLVGAAFDKDGTLIVCSESENLIYYLGENGQLLKSLTVNSPRDIMIASNGIVYVSSIVSHQIFTISESYVVQIFAGGSTAGFSNGNRLTATFNGPRGY